MENEKAHDIDTEKNVQEEPKECETSYSPQTQQSQKNLSTPQDDKLKLSFKKKLIKSKTVSLDSIFDEKNKNKKKKTTWDKIRKCLYVSVDNIYIHVFVLLLSIYSLFLEDISHLCLHPNVDIYLKYINQGVFFFFLSEFLILIIAKKKFIGSFYFYLDMISIVSLLPNCPLIWDPLLALIAGSGYLNFI
jgi:hypothetical protein